MSYEDSGQSETEYEYQPFESVFLRRRDQILQLVGLTGHALRSMEGSGRLTEVLRKPSEEVQRAQEIEALALEEAKADLPLLHGAAAVLIWGALEAAFRDFLTRWLERYPKARCVPELNNIRVRVAEYESIEGEDRMRFLVGVLERELAAALKPGAGRFECLLRPFGISPQVPDDIRRDLNELAAVRNVIVHRAGIADSRLINMCPWLGLTQGDVVSIGHEAFQRYVRASSEYAAAVIKSARVISPTSATGATAN